MSWNTEITELVRVLINDLDTTETYTDSRIERVIIIGATQVLQEVSFPTEYTVDVANITISPDPTALDPKDYGFINLVSLKTACLILGGEVKQYSLVGSISVTDGPSNINMGNVFKNIQDTAKDMCLKYAQAKLEYKMLESSLNGQTVITPSTYLGSYESDPRSSYGNIY